MLSGLFKAHLIANAGLTESRAEAIGGAVEKLHREICECDSVNLKKLRDFYDGTNPAPEGTGTVSDGKFIDPTELLVCEGLMMDYIKMDGSVLDFYKEMRSKP